MSADDSEKEFSRWLRRLGRGDLETFQKFVSKDDTHIDKRFLMGKLRLEFGPWTWNAWTRSMKREQLKMNANAVFHEVGEAEDECQLLLQGGIPSHTIPIDFPFVSSIAEEEFGVGTREDSLPTPTEELVEGRASRSSCGEISSLEMSSNPVQAGKTEKVTDDHPTQESQVGARKLREAMKAIVIVACAALAIQQVILLVDEYQSFPTNTLHMIDNVNTVPPPAFTICPKPSLKKASDKGYWSERIFYDLEDVTGYFKCFTLYLKEELPVAKKNCVTQVFKLNFLSIMSSAFTQCIENCFWEMVQSDPDLPCLSPGLLPDGANLTKPKCGSPRNESMQGDRLVPLGKKPLRNRWHLSRGVSLITIYDILDLILSSIRCKMSRKRNETVSKEIR
ncbi:unnamed protein product [Darwinula stevensoni]|uniref:Uncharacterized protein n=1 Tax=Darwinula stevensoni TaxID=69355 RepID=A0A7R8X6A2_9CRUS|nr:unnamed protein product [Darwinula stevensoni]CAG0887400.1 unnamed protein product [Darwinula stevensoni]